MCSETLSVPSTNVDRNRKAGTRQGLAAGIGVLGAVLAFAALPATTVFAADSVLTQTNWVEQSIPTVVEFRMPKNVFVTEFHTNWFDQFITNFVTLYHTNHVNVQTTNWVNKYVTNNLAMSRVRTNSVDNYRTNWI